MCSINVVCLAQFICDYGEKSERTDRRTTMTEQRKGREEIVKDGESVAK